MDDPGGFTLAPMRTAREPLRAPRSVDDAGILRVSVTAGIGGPRLIGSGGIFDSGYTDRTAAVVGRAARAWSSGPGSRAVGASVPAAVMAVVFRACLRAVRRRPSPIRGLAFPICTVCAAESQRMATVINWNLSLPAR